LQHVHHMHQRKVVSENERTGWLRRIRTCFEEGKIREYWEGDLEVHEDRKKNQERKERYTTVIIHAQSI
jgi:hypothetical protein